MRTLKAYSEFIQHPIVHLQVFYDPSDPAASDRLRSLRQIDSPAFSAFSSIELFPLGLLDLDSGSKDQQWLRRAAMCAIIELPAVQAVQLQLCLLHSQGSAASVIKACSREWNVFQLSLTKCAESEWVRSFARNLTADAKRAVYEGSRSRVLFDLAAADDEDPVLEAEADQEGDAVEMEVEVEMDDQLIAKESGRMLSEMLPVAFVVNGKRLDESESLGRVLCNVVLPSQPLVCQQRKPILLVPTQPTAVNLTIYVNTNCNNNVDALSPLMNWIISDPQCAFLGVASFVGSRTLSRWGLIL